MAKRRADKELNRDNWNDEEEEVEEPGHFQKAPEEVLKGRVIKLAKRRIAGFNNPSESEPKSIFSGFTGFAGNAENNKFSFNSVYKASGDCKSDQKPAFSFLSKTNSKSEPSNTESKPSNFSFLSSSGCDTTATKSPTFSLPKYNRKDAEKDVFKKPPKDDGSEIKSVSPSKNEKPGNFESDDKLSELSKELVKTSKQSNAMVDPKDDRNKTPDEIFLQKLRSLNLLCAEWIIKHLNENLGYILTPIFDDYKKYLTQLKEERQRANSSNKKLKIDSDAGDKISKTETPKPTFKVPDFKSSVTKLGTGKNLFAKEQTEKPGFKFTNFDEGSSSYKFTTSSKTESSSPSGKDEVGLFKFGSGAKSNDSSAAPKAGVTDSGSFKFEGFKPKEDSKSTPAVQSFFSLPNNTNAGFSFLGGNSFSASAPPATESKEDDEDTPPVKEDVTITEEGSIYDKKCKVFIKKDGNFVDHGVGFLFLKLVGDEKKCQLIVRANNKLANVIINVLLSSSVPIQLLGKNNVMLVCCPTPEAKPSSVLLKVKTTEDAEELLNIMNKHKN